MLHVQLSELVRSGKKGLLEICHNDLKWANMVLIDILGPKKVVQQGPKVPTCIFLLCLGGILSYIGLWGYGPLVCEFPRVEQVLIGCVATGPQGFLLKIRVSHEKCGWKVNLWDILLWVPRLCVRWLKKSLKYQVWPSNLFHTYIWHIEPAMNISF